MDAIGAQEMHDAGAAARRAVARERPLERLRPRAHAPGATATTASSASGPPTRSLSRPSCATSCARYKELPLTLYQIQVKFRDEIRPRFGLLRSREFIMKDAYSFHASQESLQKTYDDMSAAYGRICERMGMDYRPVEADSGQIGGSVTCEFMALAEAGEAELVHCDVRLRGQRRGRRLPGAPDRLRRAGHARRSPRPACTPSPSWRRSWTSPSPPP